MRRFKAVKQGGLFEDYSLFGFKQNAMSEGLLEAQTLISDWFLGAGFDV